jgi:hypothetical protein
MVLLAFAAPATADSSALIDEVRMAPVAATVDATVAIAPAPCKDNAYNLIGGKQTSAYRWSFKASSTPLALTKSGALSTILRSFKNITTEHNDCSRPDTVNATTTYLGTTTRSPSCNAPDGHNVVGFARLDAGVLAVTCYWMSNGKVVEADMKINNQEPWALSLALCSGNSPMLEATVTHEAGHVFGLNHVGELRHGRLTMSPYIDGPCENNEATLGLGDMLGLEHLY